MLKTEKRVTHNYVYMANHLTAFLQLPRYIHILYQATSSLPFLLQLCMKFICKWMKRGGYDLCYWMSLGTSYVYMVELCAVLMYCHSTHGKQEMYIITLNKLRQHEGGVMSLNQLIQLEVFFLVLLVAMQSPIGHVFSWLAASSLLKASPPANTKYLRVVFVAMSKIYYQEHCPSSVFSGVIVHTKVHLPPLFSPVPLYVPQ